MSASATSGTYPIIVTGIGLPAPSSVVFQFSAAGCTTVNVVGDASSFFSSTQFTLRPPVWTCANLAAEVTTFSTAVRFSQPFYFFPSGTTISSVVPRTILAGTDASITILGTNFGATPFDGICRFGVTTTALTFVSSSSIVCTVVATTSPAAATVSVEVALNGIDFTQSGTPFNFFTLTAISLDVVRGPVSGATPVFVRLTVTGVNTTMCIPMVKFTYPGSALVMSGTFVSDAQSPSGISILISTLPYLGAVIPFNVTATVSLNNGASWETPDAQFEYYADPSINSITPAGAPADNSLGVSVTLLGANFRPLPLMFCSITLASGVMMTQPASFDWASDGITLALPSFGGASGAGIAVIELSMNDRRQFTSSKRTFAIFFVQSISPSGGPITGETLVEISGIGFTSSILLKCRFGTIVVPAEYTVASSKVSCSSPMSAGEGLIPLDMSLDGASFSANSPNYFVYSKPAFTSATPTSGPSGTLLTVTISGSGFPQLPAPTPQAKCLFGNTQSHSATSGASGVVCSIISSNGLVSVPVSVAFNGVNFISSGLTFTFYDAISVDPSLGPASGGAAILVSGIGFTSGSESTVCKFGSHGTVKATVITTAQLRCTPPSASSPGSVRVDVSIDGVLFTSNSAVQYLYYTAPLVSAVTPSSGVALGGNAITVLGSGFVQQGGKTATCRFGATLASATVISATELRCTSPPGLGTVAVEISLNGIEYSSNGLLFTFYDVSSVDPTLGPASGGAALLVSGVGFAQGSGSFVCKFGSLGTSAATVINSAQLRCSTPPAATPGSVRVDVSSDGTLFTANSAVQYLYYVAPSVSAVSPTSGAALGGTVVTVRGLRFAPQGGKSVLCRFGATSVTATVISVTELRCTSPSGLGAVSVEVSLNGVDYTTNGITFTYFNVERIDPSLGPSTGGTRVTVTGSGFGNGGSLSSVQCAFGAPLVSGISLAAGQASFPGRVVDNLRVECIAPAFNVIAMTNLNVSVSVNGGASYATSSAFFTTYPPAVVTSFAPSSGPAAGNTTVTLFGSPFPRASDAIKCYFDQADSPGRLASSTEVVCTSPALSGSVEVTLTFNGIKADGSRAGIFSFFSVLGISPASGPVTGGTVVTLSGNGFASSASFWCMAESGAEIAAVFISSQAVACKLPESASRFQSLQDAKAQVGIRLTTDKITFSPVWTLKQYAVPIITAIAPRAVSASGGNVTFYGSGLLPSSLCRIGASSTANVTTFVEGTSITCLFGTSASANNQPVAVSNNAQQYHAASPNITFSFTACTRGSFAEQAADVCQPCTRGFYAPFDAATSCQVCPNGNYTDKPGSWECLGCPESTVSSGIPDSIAKCECRFGAYHPQGLSGEACTQCPAGGSCPGGSGAASLPVPQKGFWASSDAPLIFIPCDPPSACPGGKLANCAEGREGRMCAQCKDGWFKLGNECHVCSSSAPLILLGFLVFAVVIVIVLIKFGDAKSAKAYGGTIGIAVKFLQILSVIGRLQVEWPESVTSTTAAITTPFTLKFDALAPECTAPSVAYPVKWALTMLLPVFFGALFLLALGIGTLYHSVKGTSSKSLRSSVINGFLGLMSLGFLTLASTAIEPFGCRLDKDGKYTLAADPSRLCFEPWWDKIAPFAVLVIVVYVIGVPLTLFWWMRRNRHRVSEVEFSERYGGLYSAYVPSLPQWEAFVMLEKIAIAATGMLLGGFVMLQVIVLLGIFVVMSSIYQDRKPYVRGNDNRLHAILRWCCIGVLFAGALFGANRFPSENARRGIEAAALICIAAAVATIAFSVGKDLVEIKRTQRFKVDEELSAAMDVLSPSGSQIVTLFVRSSRGAMWQKSLADMFSAIKSKWLGGEEEKRKPDPSPDPVSDAVISTFTSQVFRREVEPAVRAWLLDLDPGADKFEAFSKCFTLLSQSICDSEERESGGGITASPTFEIDSGTQGLLAKLYGNDLASPALRSNLPLDVWIDRLHAYHAAIQAPAIPETALDLKELSRGEEKSRAIERPKANQRKMVDKKSSVPLSAPLSALPPLSLNLTKKIHDDDILSEKDNEKRDVRVDMVLEEYFDDDEMRDDTLAPHLGGDDVVYW